MTRIDKSVFHRRAALFGAGLLTGFAAPALLLSGAFHGVVPRRASSLNQICRDVGQFIRSSADEHERRPGDGKAA